MLERLPRILAVTAHSYGLAPQAASRRGRAAGERTQRSGDKPQAADQHKEPAGR